MGYKCVMRRVHLRLVAGMLVLFLASTVQAEWPAPTFANVRYAPGVDSFQVLDVYIPPNAIDPAPLVVHIHSGGWSQGSKGASSLVSADSLYGAGYIIADINYRLSYDSVWPAQLYDCKTAVRFLKANARRFHIDTARVGAYGESAGGHLSALLGITRAVDSLEGRHLGSIRPSGAVQAVLDLWGPTDLSKFDGQWPHVPPDSCPHPWQYEGHSDNIVNHLLGCQVSACPERARSANPIAYVRGEEPPFAIFHGSFDCIVPPIQAQLLFEALRAAGDSVTFTLWPHGVHDDPYRETAEFRRTVRTFFDGSLPARSFAARAPARPNLRVYPNPVHSTARCVMPGGVGTLSITNVVGNVVYRAQFDDGGSDEREVIIGDALPAGVYAIRWSGAVGTVSGLCTKVED